MQCHQRGHRSDRHATTVSTHPINHRGRCSWHVPEAWDRCVSTMYASTDIFTKDRGCGQGAKCSPTTTLHLATSASRVTSTSGRHAVVIASIPEPEKSEQSISSDNKHFADIDIRKSTEELDIQTTIEHHIFVSPPHHGCRAIAKYSCTFP